MDDFLKELQEAVEKEERERLGFDKMTGDASSDSALIDCDSKADYFIKLIKKNQEEIDKINDYVNSELEKTRVTYENYRNEQIESRQKQIAYFQNMLESYAYDAIQGKKTKTIKFLGGNLPKETKDLYSENYKTLMKEIKEMYLKVYYGK